MWPQMALAAAYIVGGIVYGRRILNALNNRLRAHGTRKESGRVFN